VTYSAGVVQYASSVHAWLLDLPGVICGGPDLGAVEKMMPVLIAEHVAWLRAHGEDVAPGATWAVAETIDGAATEATGGEFCFEAEKAPLSREELERYIARMEFARADLLDALAGLPDEVLDWQPPASSVARFDAWAPEVRTIREIAGHVTQLEIYYRAGLSDGPAAGIFERAQDAATERARTLDLLRSLGDEARSRVYRPVRPGRTAPEEWTVRKLVRRVISHERHHAAEVRQRRAWLLLGVG
jgi:hypothetical protein